MPIPRKEVLADGIELWLADFREVIPHEISAVNHIITDAPYEQRSHDSTGFIRRIDGGPRVKALSFTGIDDMRDDILIRAKMICDGWFLSFCTTEGIAAWRDGIEEHGLKYRTPCVWNKVNSMPKFNGQGPSHGHECIVTAWCGPGYSRWNGGGRRGMFTHCVESGKHEHETQKPLSLMMELVSLFSNRGQIVLDPFAGSGTTGVACVKTGRKFIGVEINEEYFLLARKRITEALRQGDLFVDVPRPEQLSWQEMWAKPLD